MRVVFRVDASLHIGTGHVIRCLTLAEALKQQGAEITFICREHKGNLLGRIEQQGFKTYRLPEKYIGSANDEEQVNNTERERLYGTKWLGSTQKQDAEQCLCILEKLRPEWLIVDHYSIDHFWQTLLKDSYKQLMVIDDLADRVHICDLILDQTYGRSEEDYSDYVPKNCQILLGPQYALLRPEFSQWREYSLKRRAAPELKKLLITMGGVDPDNVTGKILTALQTSKLPQELKIIVIMGETAPNTEDVQKQAKGIPYKIQIETAVNNMAELMANADLIIGSAGTTTWERCCLGVPSMVVRLADNQRNILSILSNENIILTVDEKEIEKGIKIPSKKELVTLSENSAKILNGMGTSKVIKSIYEGEYKLNGSLRNLEEADLSLIRNWRNHPKIRQYMFSQQEITEVEHVTWFDEAKHNCLKEISVYEEFGKVKGFMQLQKKSQGSKVYEWGFYISPDATRGTGTKMAKLALKKVFNELGGGKVFSTILAFNEPSIRLHYKLGFYQEAILRQQHFLNDKHSDVLCFGLLKTEWLDLAENKIDEKV